MKLNKILKNSLLVVLACFALSACATKKVSTSQIQGDVYTGTDTVEYLASGVADRKIIFISLSYIKFIISGDFILNLLSIVWFSLEA